MMTNNIFFIVADVNIHSVKKKKLFNDFYFLIYKEIMVIE